MSTLNDFRYSWRALLRNPIIAAVAVISVAAAIGPNAAMFSIMDQTFLAGSLGRAPDSLLGVRLQHENTYDDLSYAEFRELSQSGRAFSEVVASRRAGAGLRIGEARQPVVVQYVTPNFFSVLNVRMAAGRPLSPGRDDAAQDAVPLVISHSLWQRQFAGSSEAIGRTVYLHDRGATIIGVAERGFRGTAMMAQVDVWAPLELRTQAAAQRGDRDLEVLALPQPSVTEHEAARDLETLSRAMELVSPATNRGWTLICWKVGADEARARRFLTFVVLFLCSLVLMVACLNVSTLLLARAAGRRREMAVRMALGAGRWPIFRLLFAEGLLLSAMAWVAGIGLSWVLLKFAPLALPKTIIPMTLTWDVSFRSVLYAGLLGIGAALLFALAPLRQASDPDISQALRAGSPGSRGKRRLSQFAVLIIVQIAVSQALLGGAAVLLRSYEQLGRLRLGFDPNKPVLLLTVAPLASEAGGSGKIRYNDIVDRLSALPGVRRASVTGTLPLSGMGEGAYHVYLDARTGGQRERLEVGATAVGLEYFRTVGTALPFGREFTASDRMGPKTVVANEELVRRAFPELGTPAEALERTLQTEEGAFRLVGIAENGKYSNLRESRQPHMYELLPASSWTAATLLIETRGSPEEMLPAVRQELRAADPRLWIASTTTLARHAKMARYADEISGVIVSSMGLLSLFLAVVGLAGVTAYWVRRRTVEIGIRLALGSTRWEVVNVMTRQAMRPVMAGMALGLLGASLIGQAMAGLMFGVAGVDPISLLGSGFVSLVVTVGATAIPVTRAARVDPMVALRQE
jgi:predicted permease